MHKISYRRHRFHPDIIRQAVWLYFRFTMSYRDVEDPLAERGIDVSYETVRLWVLKFGRAYARRISKRRALAFDVWHLDEVFVKIGGAQMYVWRAVDGEGTVLDVLVQKRRNKRAALKLMRKLLKNQSVRPTRIVTDKLKSYGAAFRNLGLGRLHETGHRLNNRAESSHVPIRRRANTTAGTKDAAIQVTAISSDISLNSRSNLQSLQRPLPPHLPTHASNFPQPGDGGVASCDDGSVNRYNSEIRLA